MQLELVRPLWPGVTACGSFMVCGQLRAPTVRGARERLPPALDAGVPRR